MFGKQVVTDPGCEQCVQKSYFSPNKVREMVTHLGTQLFKRITPMYAPCCYNVLETITDCLKCSNFHKVMINHRLSYKLALHTL